ncbi:MAG: hypothetical protein ABI678_05855 [Kofleriaceae bacterium]
MSRCPHPEAPPVGRACTHLLVGDHDEIEVFTGVGIVSEWSCRPCATANEHGAVVDVGAACMAIVRDQGFEGIAGEPETIVMPSSIQARHEQVALACPALVDLQPVTGEDRERWIGLAADGAVYELDIATRAVRALGRASHVDPTQPLALFVSRGARFIAVANRHGTHGVVIERATWRTTIEITRDGYHTEHCAFSLAFIDRDGRTLVVYAAKWNRLELADATTGELASARDPITYERGAPAPAHYLDYFHCGLAVSPGQRTIADAGWVWAPVGLVSAWSVDGWLANPYESEDGPSLQRLGQRAYFWDGPMAWLDDRRLLLWGYGEDDEWLIPAAVIRDTHTGEIERWFAGVPRGELWFDRWLHAATGLALTVWDVERGARLVEVPSAVTRYHPDAKCFATIPVTGVITLVRLAGHDASWRTGTIDALVTRGDPDDLPILGDALEAAGYTDEEVLVHCRRPGAHAGRCWVFDRFAR